MLCFVDIHGFLSTLPAGIDPAGYQTRKPQQFNASHFTGPFLNPSELKRVNGFKTLKKQVEWISGRYAVKTLVKSQIPSAGSYEEIEIGYRKSGAPVLNSFHDINISISHSGRYAAGALSPDKNLHIGMDLERIKYKNLDAILHVAFSDHEKKVMTTPDPATVYQAWTVKEAFMKLIQKGFNESLKKIEYIDKTVIYNKTPLPGLNIHTETLCGNYAFALISTSR